jgi:hypothetical protein
MAPPVEGAEPDNGTLALSFYQAARAEIVQRIGLRESTLIAWITSAGVLIGWGVTQPPHAMRIAEVLPWVSLAFGLLIFRHSTIIDALSNYLNHDLYKGLRQNEEHVPRHWDLSNSLHEKIPTYLVLEGVAYLLIQNVPPVLAMTYLYVYHPGLICSSTAAQAALLATVLTIVLGAIFVFYPLKAHQKSVASRKREASARLPKL